MKFPQTIFGAPVPLSLPTPPALSDDVLAEQIPPNWAASNPQMEHLLVSKDTLDDSLTSLNWLQNMNLNLGDPSTPPASPQVTIVTNELTRVNPNQVLATNLRHKDWHVMDVRPDQICSDPTYSIEKIDYKNNPYIKPPYSYATLICMAMKSSKKNKLTLAAIYNWITENFMFYRMADPSWQNSIRHNLSLNKCFQKVARRKDEPGKGGFWRVNPEYNALLDNGALKKKLGGIDLFTSSSNGGKPAELTRNKRNSTENRNDSKKRRGVTADEDSEAALSLAEYLNIDKLLNEDIEVGGVRLRASDIISDSAQDTDSNFMTLSSPSSDDTSDSFEDLLSGDLNQPESSGDRSNSTESANMAIQGVKIEPPGWWSDSLTGNTFSGLLTTTDADPLQPWSSEKDIDDAMAALDDMEKLFSSSFNKESK